MRIEGGGEREEEEKEEEEGCESDARCLDISGRWSEIPRLGLDKMGGREKREGCMMITPHTQCKNLRMRGEGKGELWNIVFIFYVFSDVRHSFIHPSSRLTHTVLKETLNPKKG
jgi:hypothetical protein